ncbi:MAG: efflux RND transporter permease subunit, partial [Fusobacterium sp.]
LKDGRVSQLTIVPFYDRSELIYETLGTLEEAISLQVLITILVVIVMVYNLRASFLISSILPIAVLMVFIAMRYFGIDANIVALSGIAIAIGTMVDLGIVLSENVINHIKEAPKTQKLKESIYNASAEVSSAIVTAVATTIVSFVPVFTMQAAEGKLFIPLAFTKTFALIAALIVSLLILPSLANLVFSVKVSKNRSGIIANGLLILGGLLIALFSNSWGGITLIAFGLIWFIRTYGPWKNWLIKNLTIIISVISVTWILANYWMPLGAGKSTFINFLFVASIIFLILGAFALLEKYYSKILEWCLAHKKTFLTIPTFIILLALVIWIGFNRTFGFVSYGFSGVGVNIESTKGWSFMAQKFPGIGKEFMPSLDEGSFLLMPTSMPHAGMEQNKRVVQQLDMLLANIPEVKLAVGKMGRAETALDPAPISMYENIINYKPEYALNKKGHRERFEVNQKNEFILKSGESISQRKAITEGISKEDLILYDDGKYFRNWREHIHSPNDIWKEILKKAKIPGLTSAPKLQPIETRLVMLSTGMRAPMGIKVFGPDLETIEKVGYELETILKEVPTVEAGAVFADRVVGKPYLEIEIDRVAIGRYGLKIEDMQAVLGSAIGGMKLTTTVEGRERFPVRVR